MNKTFLEQLQKQMIDNIEEEDTNTRQEKEVYLVPLEKKKSRMVGAMVSVAALLLIIVCIFLMKQPLVRNQKEGIGAVVPSQTDKPFVTEKPVPTEPVTDTDKSDVVLKELKNTTEMNELTKNLSKMQTGEEMPAVDYAKDDLFVVHDYNYLLVFDTVKNKIVRAISLDFPEAKGNCERVAVSVSIDLTRIYIQLVDSKKEGICYDAVTYLRRIEYDGGIVGGSCGGNYTATIDNITEASIVAMIPEYGKQGVETMKEEKKGYEKLYKKGLYHNYSDDVSLKTYDFEVK